MKKFLALVLCLAMVTMCTAALADGNVTVSWYNFGDAFSSYIRDNMTAKFQELGVDFTMKDSNNIQQTQNDDIEAAINNGASVIVVQMVDSGAYATAKTILQKGIDAGIPVVFFSRVMSTDDAECAELVASYPGNTIYVGTNPAEAGVMQGNLIGEKLLANYDAFDLNGDGVISYVMLKGDMANQEAIFRTTYSVEYANKALEAAGKPKLQYYDASAPTNGEEGPYIVDPSGSWSQTFGNETMTTILAQYNESNGNMPELIIANNDDMAIGAINALKVAGYNQEGATVIPVFGVDATDQAKEFIARGEMAGSILQDAVKYGKNVAIIAKNLLDGKPMLEGIDDDIVIGGEGNWEATIPYAMYTGE